MSKTCHGGRVHNDALALVEYLVGHGGKVAKPNEAVAYDLLLMKSLGGGHMQIDVSRLGKARQHIQDIEPLCCSFGIHYRSSAKGSEFTLIDPTGSLGDHAVVAIESIKGDLQRMKQHKTENLRRIATWNALGDHSLAVGNRDGYRVAQRAAVEIETVGIVTDATMADVYVWLDSLRGKS